MISQRWEVACIAVGNNQPEGALLMRGTQIYNDSCEICQATDYKCNYWKHVGYMENCCNKKNPPRHIEMMQTLKAIDNETRGDNYSEDEDSEEETDNEEEQLVLRVNGKDH